MDEIRRVDLTIKLNNIDITTKIKGYIKKFSSIDNYEGNIDSLYLELDNRKKDFLKPNWAFKIGDKITIGCKTKNWERLEGEKTYIFGEYFVDERLFNKGSLVIKGLAIPLLAKNTINSKTWKEITIIGLATELANKYKLTINSLLKRSIILENIEQQKETDFSLLKKICESEGVMIKITKDKLILFEDDEMETGNKVLTLDLDHTKSYNFGDTSNSVYGSVEINYFNSKNKKTTKETFSLDENNAITNKILKINSDSKNKRKDYKQFALTKLKNVNKKNNTINITIIGKAGIYGGQILEIINSGILDGNYLMTTVKQDIPNFITTIEAYKV